MKINIKGIITIGLLFSMQLSYAQSWKIYVGGLYAHMGETKFVFADDTDYDNILSYEIGMIRQLNWKSDKLSGRYGLGYSRLGSDYKFSDHSNEFRTHGVDAEFGVGYAILSSTKLNLSALGRWNITTQYDGDKIDNSSLIWDVHPFQVGLSFGIEQDLSPKFSLELGLKHYFNSSAEIKSSFIGEKSYYNSAMNLRLYYKLGKKD